MALYDVDTKSLTIRFSRQFQGAKARNGNWVLVKRGLRSRKLHGGFSNIPNPQERKRCRNSLAVFFQHGDLVMRHARSVEEDVQACSFEPYSAVYRLSFRRDLTEINAFWSEFLRPSNSMLFSFSYFISHISYYVFHIFYRFHMCAFR